MTIKELIQQLAKVQGDWSKVDVVISRVETSDNAGTWITTSTVTDVGYNRIDEVTIFIVDD